MPRQQDTYVPPVLEQQDQLQDITGVNGNGAISGVIDNND